MVHESSDAGIALGSPAGRIVVATTVLGSAVAMLTATVVNVALPTMATDLGASTADQQWIVNAYLLPLASLIMLGGTLGDRFGRRLVYRVGLVVFAVASVGCAAAPGIEVLLGFRFLQGVGGALLTPGSLAIIEASIAEEDRGRAIGTWSGLGGLAGAIGPVLGGLLVAWSWRWVFLLNLPVALAVLVLSRWIPESRDPDAMDHPIDVWGSVLTVLALGGLSYGLIEGAGGWTPTSLAALGISAGAAVGLAIVEPRMPNPMLPVDLAGNRTFVIANVLSLFVYSALGLVFLLLSIQLQVVTGWAPAVAGAALLPVTVMMVLFSARAGEVTQRIGPKIPLTVGPWVMAVGMLLFARIGADAGYVTHVLPAATVFGLGLAMSVAPVTTAALSSVPESRAGAASGTNNAITRTGTLLAVAAVPPMVGLGGDALSDPAALAVGFPQAVYLAAGLMTVGGLVALVGLPSKVGPAPVSKDEVANCPMGGPLRIQSQAE